MSDKYYFVASLLPELVIGHVPALGFFELKEILRVNLSEEDKKKVRHFLRLIDLENLRALWAHEPHDPRGNLTREELEKALENQEWSDEEPFPEYLIDFLDKYESKEERVRHFSLVMTDFLVEGSLEEGFLGAYFAFERELRLVLTAFRAKKLGRNLDEELQYEDPYDPFIAELLAQKEAKTFEPPFDFLDLRERLEFNQDLPLELHLALSEYRFMRIVELSEGEFFSIDRILSYMARLLLVEKWLELDQQAGIKVIDTVEGKIP